MPNHVVLDNEAMEHFNGEIPEQGDWITIDAEDYLVTRVAVENQSKVELKVERERERKEYSDPAADSVDWPTLEEYRQPTED